MGELERVCWYASWCSACGFKQATRKWLVDAVVIQWVHYECASASAATGSLSA